MTYMGNREARIFFIEITSSVEMYGRIFPVTFQARGLLVSCTGEARYQETAAEFHHYE